MPLDRVKMHEVMVWRQDGVIARRQILDLGGDDNDIERMLRRREISALLPGVYLTHTGRPTRLEREWAAVLAYWPAGLDAESALDLRAGSEQVEIVVGKDRRIAPPYWIVARRATEMETRVSWLSRPPRVGPEDALLDLMSRRIRSGDAGGAFAALAAVCHRHTTTPGHVLAALKQRTRIGGRRQIEAMVADLRDGACSVLERAYLNQVERAHGLPKGKRQVRSRATGRTTFQDIRYDPYGVIVEPDGRAYHEGAAAHDRDARRDLAELLADGSVTARVTYSMVSDNPCWTAQRIARLLQQRGWEGRTTPCHRCQPAGTSASSTASGVSPGPGAGRTPASAT